MAHASTKPAFSHPDFYRDIYSYSDSYSDSYSPAASNVYAHCSALAGNAFREIHKMIMPILKIMPILVDKKASRTTYAMNNVLLYSVNPIHPV